MNIEERTLSAAPPGTDHATLASLTRLLSGSHLSTADQLPDIVAAAGRALGWDVVVHLITFDQRRLVPFAPLAGNDAQAYDVEEAGPGEAFRTVRTVTDGASAWVPLLDGVERVGVLRVVFPGDDAATAVSQERVRDQLNWFSLLIGHLVAVMTPNGDTITRLRGGLERTVEAELLWNLLPPLTYACDGLVVSGLLEPSERVAGDVFDYAVEDGTATFALFDGSGHNLDSGLLSSVTLATYRTHRRRGADLSTCAAAIDEILLRHTDGTGYATGVLAELDRRTGVLRYVNAGHPRPLLLRGGTFLKTLDSPGRPLFGLGDAAVTVGEEQLKPGDQLVLYTDGITEARTEDGDFFGLQALIALLERSAAAASPAPETLRQAVQSVLDHQRGVLQDDATMMLVEWGATTASRLIPA